MGRSGLTTRSGMLGRSNDRTIHHISGSPPYQGGFRGIDPQGRSQKDAKLSLVIALSHVIAMPELSRFFGIFAPLKDPTYFATVQVNPELVTIVWANGADLDPDVLILPHHPTTHPKFHSPPNRLIQIGLSARIDHL